jgi:hypothetical protein
MHRTLSHPGAAQWIRQAMSWACVLALSTGLGYSMNTALSGGAPAQEVETGISTVLPSADPDHSLPRSATEHGLVDRCAWDYTLWIGAETHPFGC